MCDKSYKLVYYQINNFLKKKLRQPPPPPPNKIKNPKKLNDFVWTNT